MDKSSLKDSLGKLLVDLALHKVDVWTTRRLGKYLRSGHIPVCAPLNKNTWSINNFKLQKLSDFQYNLWEENTLINVFFSVQAAVFYAAFKHSKNQYHAELARALLLQDKRVGLLYDKMMFFQRKSQNKNRKINSFKVNIYKDRYYEARLKFKQANHELLKNLQSAKYIKVWDKKL